MDRRTTTRWFQIFSCILAPIIFTNGQYQALNLGKKLKAHELDYGTLLSSIETGGSQYQRNNGAREQLKSSVKKMPKESDITDEDVAGVMASMVEVTETTDPLLTTRCTTNKAITMDDKDLPTEGPSDEDTTQDPNEDTSEAPTDDPTEDPTEDSNEPTNLPTEDPTEDPNEPTNSPEDIDNEVDPTMVTDDTKPPTTKVYLGPAKTHVPDHYLDDV